MVARAGASGANVLPGVRMANPKIQFCLNFTQQEPLMEVAKWWQACDAGGLKMVGVPDSPALLRELYVSATLCALSTSRIQVLTSVTNPLTRHPSVTAAALMSLNELAPGRIACGIATGDSAIWGVGLKSAKVETLRNYILAVKALLRGEAATWRGTTFKAEWSAWSPPVEVPIYVACSGPKVLRMAAEVADGMLVTMGFAPADIEGVQRIIAEGAAAAGRAASDLDVWWNASVTFAESPAAAMESTFGWGAQWLTMGSLEGKGIPDEYKEALLELNADTHDLTNSYKTPGRGRALVERAKKLGLHDWLIERSPRLWGTAADINARLAELAGQGLHNWVFYVGGPGFDRMTVIDRVAKEIVPEFA